MYRYIAIGMLYIMIAVALIAAKFIGHLHLAWWIVLSPIWAPVVLFFIVAILAIVGFAGAESRGENLFE